MDLKLVFAIVGGVIGFAAFIPYLRDIFRKKTQPHIYTWLIWGLSEGTAVAALWYGGGGVGSTASILASVVLVFFIFFLSFKYGTKNITKIDTLLLITALLAILVWWQLNNALLAVILATAIDPIGYLPNIRKTFQEPWSETMSLYVMSVIATLFTILALREYNALTLTYIVAISVANLILITVMLVRRVSVPKPYG